MRWLMIHRVGVSQRVPLLAVVRVGRVRKTAVPLIKLDARLDLVLVAVRGETVVDHRFAMCQVRRTHSSTAALPLQRGEEHLLSQKARVHFLDLGAESQIPPANSEPAGLGRIAPDARSSVGAPHLILAGVLLLFISPSCSGRQSPIMPFKNAYSGFTLSGAKSKKEEAIPRVAVDDISPEDFFKK